jgi:hypothetical protein
MPPVLPFFPSLFAGLVAQASSPAVPRTSSSARGRLAPRTRNLLVCGPIAQPLTRPFGFAQGHPLPAKIAGRGATSLVMACPTLSRSWGDSLWLASDVVVAWRGSE